jgi:hypothetical protein
MSRALVTALALALLHATPALAAQDTLLSGYGGPGQGEQVLLGAELIGGSSSAAPSAPRRATSPAQIAVVAPRLVNPAAPGASGTGSESTSRTPGTRPASSGAGTGTSAAPAAPARAAPASDPATSPPAALAAGRAGWPLTAGQGVAALLALAALAAVATTTPRLARRT